MAFDGNGNFILPYNWQTDKANGIKIRADRMDGQDQAIADGLTDCVTRDGQSPATANLPMGGFKHTNVSAASSRTEYARASQLQDNDLTYFTASGTIDSYTLNPSPAITARTPGLAFYVRIPTGKTSTSTTPVISVSGVFTATIANADGSPLSPGDLVAEGVYHMLDQGTIGMVLVNKQAIGPTDSYASGATGTVAWGTYPTSRQFVYPSTAGMNMMVPSTTHGKFIMLIKQGPYALNLTGTINGVVQTITITDQLTLPMTYSTIDGAT